MTTEKFSVWVRNTRDAQKTQAGAQVPCGECRGCCTSAYFIHVGPDENETLAHIPAAWLFPAPGLPKGHKLMGYDERGHCPMFVENRCSIYAHRPQTCRDYDCRIFPATGIPPEENKPAIANQAERWKFSFPDQEDQWHFSALRSAAKFLSENASAFPPGFVPINPLQQAVLALQVYDVFLDMPEEDAWNEPGKNPPRISIPETVKAVLDVCKKG